MSFDVLLARMRMLKLELRELQTYVACLQALRAVHDGINLKRLHSKLIYLCHPDRGGNVELSRDVNSLFSALLGEVLQ